MLQKQKCESGHQSDKQVSIEAIAEIGSIYPQFFVYFLAAGISEHCSTPEGLCWGWLITTRNIHQKWTVLLKNMP